MSKADFCQGFAVAMATLIRTHDLPSVAVDIANSNGLRFRDFVNAKVTAFDLIPIRKAFKDEGELPPQPAREPSIPPSGGDNRGDRSKESR